MMDEVLEFQSEGDLPASVVGADPMGAAALKLGHPMGNRRTDPVLAQAALAGHLGRRPSYPGDHASLTEGLRRQQPGMLRRAWDALLRRTTIPIVRRRWYLRRDYQQDQGQTPQCVAFTQKHWELSVPTQTRTGLPPAEMYARCKAIDRWPGEDGTSADAMLTVCQELGIVKSHWWWTGPEDNEAAIRWLLDIGPLWFGSAWSESMFRTRRLQRADGSFFTDGQIDVTGDLLYGHEVLVIGRSANLRGQGPAVEIVQSWGRENYGIDGRGWILERDFFDRLLVEGGGDLVGVVEARRLP